MAICAYRNIFDKLSREECEKDDSNKSVHDEGDDGIVSHHKSMYLVQSCLRQEEGQTTTVDNKSMSVPEKFTIGPKHNQNTTDTPSKRILIRKNVER